MLRRTFIRQALALCAAPALLAPVGCGAGGGVEQPAKYNERPATLPQLQGGGKAKGAAGGASKGGNKPADPQ